MDLPEEKNGVRQEIRNMKNSIKKQIAYTFIGLMAGTILLCWFINNTFLESFYVIEKQKTLMNAYERINKAVNDEDITSEEFDIEFRKICSTGNIDILIVDSSGISAKSSVDNSDFLIRKLYDYIFRGDLMKVEIIESSKDYILQKSRDQLTNIEYLEVWGYLDNGNLFIMRTAVESIIESVKLANRFLAYVGVIAVFISAFVIWIVTRKLTDPILELAVIAEKMTNLDFDAKYQSGGENEIAMLGSYMNQMSDKLETVISELKTANNELQSDIQKKEEIDEMRKEFLSNVSHELKTPIALIQGYAEGLKEGISDDEESREYYCEVIMDEAAKMNRMVKKLLTLNQLEFGNEVVAMERFDLVLLIKNMIQASDILLKQKEITVRFENENPVYVWADEFKTEEVLMNYFSNAINHAANEKIIVVKIIGKESTVRVSVFNTGIPIPEEAIEQVWTKFYKVDKARTREYGGSGIGLSIVKAIMEAFHQQYGVENYDNGVEFWFELDSSGSKNEVASQEY